MTVNHPKASVLYVIGSLAVGGTEKHLTRAAIELKNRGWNIGIFAIDPTGPLREKLVSAGVSVYGWSMPEWLQKIIRIRKLRTLVKICVNFLLLVHLLRREEPEVTHFFLPEAYIMGGFASLFARDLVRIMSRRSMNDYQKKHAILTKAEKFLHSHMDAVFGNSKRVIAQLEEEGINSEKLHLTYNGVDMSLFNREKHKSTKSLVMIMIANLIPYKGHSDLLNALSLINDKLPKGWEIWLVGRDDGIGQDLATLAENLGIAKNVKFMGSRMDIPELLNMSDIGILSSHQEGFSNSVLECMAAGLPMVVTDVGGNAEAIIDGQNGYVVPPHKPEDLAQAILKLAQNRDARDKMGAISKQWAQDKFSIEASIDGYEQLYNGFLRHGNTKESKPAFKSIASR